MEEITNSEETRVGQADHPPHPINQHRGCFSRIPERTQSGMHKDHPPSTSAWFQGTVSNLRPLLIWSLVFPNSKCLWELWPPPTEPAFLLHGPHPPLPRLRRPQPLPRSASLAVALTPAPPLGSRSVIAPLGSPAVSYTHLTLPTNVSMCRSRWSPYH